MITFLSTRLLTSSSILALVLSAKINQATELPEEKMLWPSPEFHNSIHYDTGEKVRQNQPPSGSLSGSNRVYSLVANPTYSIHRAPENVRNGVGLVICPGGGYRDIWLDREGNDLALWLKPKGVTSLVLKYRTNAGEGQNRTFAPGVYQPAVLADAREALRILRSQAAELSLDPNKIGICGFSAGGNLAFNTVFHTDDETAQDAIQTTPDFVGLFYPGLRDDLREIVPRAKHLPPFFIMNASDDRTTPAARCADLYLALLKAGLTPEMHLFGKGGHGFDLGEGRGESAPLWKEAFFAWLKDSGFVR